MVRTVKPKARETPTKPMPRFGNPAARTAAPQPPNTSQKVPKTSAAIRRDISMISPHPLLEATRFNSAHGQKRTNLCSVLVGYTEDEHCHRRHEASTLPVRSFI